jgi:3-isopropylmalate/(R)-2-methylmalate dehydratase small subunit
MEPFTAHTGRAVYIGRADIDTDQIVPARFCKRITRTGFSDALFAQWREQQDFVLNDPRRAGASFLVTGTNFGIGSSREHAVWALRDYGFKAVISARFGEIFHGNALKNGLLPVVLPAAAIAGLAGGVQGDADLQITVDLEALQVRAGAGRWPFDLDEGARQMILNGLDEIDISSRRLARLTAYESGRPRWLPVVRPRVTAG